MPDRRSVWHRPSVVAWMGFVAILVGVFAWAMWRRAGIYEAIISVCINISVAACVVHMCVDIARAHAGDSGRESNLRWVIRALKKPLEDSAGQSGPA